MATLYVAIIISLCALLIDGVLIDPQKIPLGTCEAYSPCWHYTSRPDPIGPCGIDTSQCPFDSENCGMYDSTCYCQQTMQLGCAWSCSWDDWMNIENWLFKECPNAPTIDFKRAPKCAAQCLAEKTVDYGCLTRNTNCFCLHGDLFECNYKCGEKDKGKLKSWLMDTCKVSEARAQTAVTSSDFRNRAVDSGTEKNEPIFKERKRRPPRWYEGLAIALLGSSFLASIGFFVWMRYSERRHPIRAKSRCAVDSKVMSYRLLTGEIAA